MLENATRRRLFNRLLPARQRQIFYYLRLPTRPVWRPAVHSRDHVVRPLRRRTYYLCVEDRLCDGHFTLFDAYGVPIRGTPANPRYNVTTVCAYALAHWNLYLNGQDSALPTFLAMAGWLAQQQAEDGAWYYTYDFNFGVKAPWVSAMAQGEALSVLARAYGVSGHTAYREAGDSALSLFEREVASGGVVEEVPPGYLFFEEAPSSPPSHILNGFLYALFGLYDWQMITIEPSRTLWQAGLETLTNLLQHYDLGYWSRYDLYPGRPHAASFAYHDLHIAQLYVLRYMFTGSALFINDILSQWEGYRMDLRCRLRAAFGKWRHAIAPPWQTDKGQDKPVSVS